MSDEIDEIWQLFADDGAQSLDMIEEILLFLKANPNGQADVAGLFRAMHTFKGNSRVLGLGVIESRAHLAEDLIGLVRDDGVPLGPELRELLIETVDALRGMLEATLASRRDPDEAATAELAARMQAMFHRCKDAPRPEATAPPLVEGVIFDPVPQAALAEDPMYREIFCGMARDALVEMRGALEAFPSDAELARATLTSEAERLRFAAEQIGLQSWREPLAAFAAQTAPSLAAARSLADELTAMLARDFAAASADEDPAAAADSIDDFFAAIAPNLAAIADADDRLSRADAVGGDELGRLADEIEALCGRAGFARLAQAADGFRGASGNSAKFRRARFRFYDELAAIVDANPREAEALHMRPLADLRAWCAECAPKILLNIRGALDRMRLGDEADEPVSESLRFVFHGCAHHQMDMAAQLSMALFDLFARAENAGKPADPVLQHIARAFVAAMELVFDAANAGHSPDMSAVEALFQDAATATFASSSHIEARLGLPPSFHNLLSPESVKTALAAMDSGLLFYIVRADLNANDDLASAFLSWIGSGAATVISNVTVFQGDVSLFDFLIASALDATALAEALAWLDPSATALKIETTLADRDARQRQGDGALAAGVSAQEAMSAAMLESIGAIVTGQASIHNALAELSQDDLARAVEIEMRRAGGEWNAAREPIARYLGALQEKIEKLAQAESQVKGLLDRLQEEAIAIRNRSGALLLRPLATLADILARQCGREIVVTAKGEESQLDFSTLEALKEPARALVAFAVQQSLEEPERRLAAGKDRRGRLDVSLVKQDDQVIVAVEDDGRGIDLARVAQRAAQLGWQDDADPLSLVLREGYGPASNGEASGEGADLAAVHAALRAFGGELRIACPPSGGLRAVAAAPLAMALLEGMVVRVGKITYVVPIDSIRRIVHCSAGDLMRISAAEGRYMLKLAADDVLPVKFLERGGDGEEETDPLTQAFRALESGDGGDDEKHLFVVVRASHAACALSVDELIGQETVLARPLQGHLAGIRGVSGCALLSGGRVGMVLDMSCVSGEPAPRRPRARPAPDSPPQGKDRSRLARAVA